VVFIHKRYNSNISLLICFFSGMFKILKKQYFLVKKLLIFWKKLL